MNEDENCELNKCSDNEANKCSYDDVRNGICNCWNEEHDDHEPEDLENWKSGPKLTDKDIPF